MATEHNPECWKQFTVAEWENPRGPAVAAFVRLRDEKDTGFIRHAEAACKAAGADFSKFASNAAFAIKEAEAADKTRTPSKAMLEAEKVAAGPRMNCLASIQPKEMKWLWPPYIPIGALTIIQGDPGCGKTHLMAKIAAMVTTGGTMFDGQTLQQGSCIFQSIEDGLAEGLVPRLITAGADMTKCHAFDESDEPLYVQDLERIESAIKTLPDLRIFVIDPIQSYLGPKTDMNRANEVRAALKGLLALCNRYDIALVMIGHMGKSQNKDLYRLLGSMDFVAQARSVLSVGENQTMPGERVVIQIKVSNAKQGEPFAYHIDNYGAHFAGFRPGFTEQDMKMSPPEGEGRLEDAVRFVLSALEERPMTVQEMTKAGKAADVTSRTLRRARDDLRERGQIAVYRGSLPSWYWHLKSKKIVAADGRLVYFGQVGQILETPAAVSFDRDQAFGKVWSNGQLDQPDQNDQFVQDDQFVQLVQINKT